MSETITNPIALSLFASRVSAICEEMGAVLSRTAVSPNIRDRLDYSCALFAANGDLIAQATHIPVHLGSMAYAMTELAASRVWCEGDVMILNDPFAGGTHLPDVTIIAALVEDDRLLGFAASRAHYADIGSAAPGSMPVSDQLEQEGVLITPRLVYAQGDYQPQAMAALYAAVGDQHRVEADFKAQLGACRTGCKRLQQLIIQSSRPGFEQLLTALNDYAERITRHMLSTIPDGEYTFTDVMDSDGFAAQNVAIRVTLHVQDDQILADFSATDAQVPGNINCPLSVTAAGMYYVVRCVLPDYTPTCAGVLRALQLHTVPGTLVHAIGPAAVAAGNVETSMRIVDVLCGALQQAVPDIIPAASQGTMNNVAMGGVTESADGVHHWSYYETLAGGCGAAPDHDGQSAVHSHMTNTLNTPIEVLETEYPLQMQRYALRNGSGGLGKYSGGDGIIREYQLLAPTIVSLIHERRNHQPWGLNSGAPGKAGQNRLNGQLLDGKVSFEAATGDVLTIETPGGGGWGKVETETV